MRIVYLHGFASSPQSSKAQFFARKFGEEGILFAAPALDGGDFEHLTITGQLEIVEATVGSDSNVGGPVVLMGSSLGGYLAALFAARHPEKVDRLILLAPAFHFMDRWRARLGDDGLDRWKKAGRLPFFHYGYQRERPLSFQLMEDAGQYEPEPNFRQPALLFHGEKDDVVPYQGSLRFAALHAAVEVRLFPSGHELTDVVDEMWQATRAFLQIGGGAV